VEYVNEAGQELAARATWQALKNEAVFTTVPAMVQGTIQALAGPGYAFMVNNTMWNRSQRRPIFGPLSDADWQQIQAMFVAGPFIQYHIEGNQLQFFPVPAAGQTVAFEWVSNLWCTSSTGAPQTSLLTDTDLALLDERVITLDALWRFKRANQLAYDEDYNKAQAAIEDLIARDGSKPTLNLKGAETDFFPGVLVPAGNFTL